MAEMSGRLNLPPVEKAESVCSHADGNISEIACENMFEND
jgi:hypothetical protein